MWILFPLTKPHCERRISISRAPPASTHARSLAMTLLHNLTERVTVELGIQTQFFQVESMSGSREQ